MFLKWKDTNFSALFLIKKKKQIKQIETLKFLSFFFEGLIIQYIATNHLSIQHNCVILQAADMSKNLRCAVSK